MSATEQDWLYASDRRDAERNHINASWLLGKADATICDLKAQLATARKERSELQKCLDAAREGLFDVRHLLPDAGKTMKHRSIIHKALRDSWHVLIERIPVLARDEGKGENGGE